MYLNFDRSPVDPAACKHWNWVIDYDSEVHRWIGKCANCQTPISPERIRASGFHQ